MVGDVVEVSGILSKTNSGYRVLPRDNFDVQTVGSVSEPELKTASSTATTLKKAALPVAAGGATTAAIAMLWQQKTNRPRNPELEKNSRRDDVEGGL